MGYVILFWTVFLISESLIKATATQSINPLLPWIPGFAMGFVYLFLRRLGVL